MLVAAMAQRCKKLIVDGDRSTRGLLPSLQPTHLEWMCDQIEKHSGDWPATKLHRWIGFAQAAMIANHMLDLAGAKAMFDSNPTEAGDVDQDLLDHLDPSSTFELELGGEG